MQQLASAMVRDPENTNTDDLLQLIEDGVATPDALYTTLVSEMKAAYPQTSREAEAKVFSLFKGITTIAYMLAVDEEAQDTSYIANTTSFKEFCRRCFYHLVYPSVKTLADEYIMEIVPALRSVNEPIATFCRQFLWRPPQGTPEFILDQLYGEGRTQCTKCGRVLTPHHTCGFDFSVKPPKASGADHYCRALFLTKHEWVSSDGCYDTFAPEEK